MAKCRENCMKALTICQPFAELIMRGQKLVENRTWSTPYRGPLAIHAGKNRDWLELDDTGAFDEFYNIPIAEMAFGAIVGTAELVACLPILAIRSLRYEQRYPWLNDHDHTEGPWCWVLENVKRFAEPIPARGAQGIWEWAQVEKART